MSDIGRCVQCQIELDLSAAEPFERVVCPSCGVEQRVKTIFGQYELVDQFAVGGMSMLYRAKDRTLGREVALKVLSEEYSSDSHRIAEFEKEAELTALVNHPHVVKVFSVGRAFGRFYIAMELLEGKNLDEHLSNPANPSVQKVFPEEKTRELAVQVASGLQAAAEAGLIHRDIKPGNILLDDEGQAKIVDFGLSLVTQAGQARAEELFATPFYAPPEALGMGTEDFRSDIYALGATLYQLLVGRPPIDCETTDVNVLLEAKRKPVLLRAYRESISPKMEALVQKMMSYEVADRPSSYHELLDSLSFSSSEGGRSDSESARTLAKELQKRKVLQRAILSCSAVIVVGLALGAWKVLGKKGEAQSKGNSAGLVVAEGAEGNDISDAYERARKQLNNGNLAVAGKMFKALGMEQDVPEPARSWAGLEGVLCGALVGNFPAGEGMMKTLASRVDQGEWEPYSKKSFEDLRLSFQCLSSVVPPKEPGDNAEESLLQFALCLRHWDVGSRAGENFLKQFVVHDYSDRSSWVEPYQREAKKYLDDFAILDQEAPEWSKDSWSESDLESEIVRLDDVRQRLKTLGRAPFTVIAWQETLAQQVRFMAETPSWKQEEKFEDD